MFLGAPQRGQVMPLVAVAALLLVAVAGLAVDVGYHQYRQRVQQTATDSAAIAAGQELLYGSGAAVAAGQHDASVNGFTDTTGGNGCTATATCVTVTAPDADADDAFYNTPDTVEVVIQTPNSTFFEPIFGIKSVNITTKAVAKLVDEPSDNCVVMLSPTIQSNYTGATVNAPNCGLAFNATVGWNNATVDAASITCAPTATCQNPNATFTNAQPQSGTVSDPCPQITYCAAMTDPAPTCSSPQNVRGAANKALTLTPGCYSGITANKSTSITLGCGLYVITGTFNARPTGNNPISIPITQSCPLGGPAGVTLYLTGGGSIDFGNDTINLSAPATGDYSQYSAGEQNVLLYQDPSDTSTVNLNSAGQSCGLTSCNSYFSGMIYAPSALLNYNQYTTTSTGQVLLIAGGMNANGNIDNFLSAPGGPTSTVKHAVLAE
jgi:Putative Flp pilus-assembly TadE/G-like